MREHSSRVYNKSKVTRFRTKSTFKAASPQKLQRYKITQILPRDKNYKKVN